MEPSYTSSLADMMTSLMSRKINPRHLQEKNKSWSISQNSGKLRMKKMKNIIHTN